MTQLLLRIFVKDRENAADPKVRSRIGKLSGFVGILCNFLLFALKITVGTISGSVAITADAMNNFSDATSSVVTLIGFKLAEKPADEDHPYGHARYEYLSGLAVAAMIVVIGVELGQTSVQKILNPSPVEFTIPVAVVLIGSILVKLWLSLFNSTLGKKISSDTLLATATDSRNDVISTGAVLLAAVVQAVFKWNVDGIMGLLVALFILYSGAMMAKDIISPLLGETASPELRELIVKEVENQEKILGYHDLMVHDYGPGQRFASMHVEMDQKEDPLQCHELIDEVERRCLDKHNVHLVLHYDPVITGDAEMDRLRTVVQEILSEIDSRISIHDFRMVRGTGHSNLIFDMALPSELMKRQKELKKQMDAALADREPGTYYTVVTFDLATFNE